MLCSNSPRLRSAQPPLFETSPITMCPSLACTPSTGLHASPPIKIHPVLLTQSTPLLISASHSFFERAPHSPCSFRVVSCARRSWCMCGVPHHPPLTLTPLGLATQDFRLASGTFFSPAECNLRGKAGGVLVPCYSSTIQGTITARHCDHTF